MMMQTLDTTFSALADPTRRAILAVLAKRRELSVGEIAAPFGISRKPSLFITLGSFF